jgi:hypothetical protein
MTGVGVSVTVSFLVFSKAAIGASSVFSILSASSIVSSSIVSGAYFCRHSETPSLSVICTCVVSSFIAICSVEKSVFLNKTTAEIIEIIATTAAAVEI